MKTHINSPGALAAHTGEPTLCLKLPRLRPLVKPPVSEPQHLVWFHSWQPMRIVRPATWAIRYRNGETFPLCSRCARRVR